MWNDETKNLLRKAVYAALVAAVLAFAKALGIVVPVPVMQAAPNAQSVPCQCHLK